MFPLQRGNELVIQFSNQQQHTSKISQQDLIIHDHEDYDFSDQPRVITLTDSHKIIGNNNINAPTHKKVNKHFHHHHASSDHNINNKKMKKMMIHRDIERQRRQEMATLYASLRSLIPPHYIKGKRSISDHMNEAVNYIKHLKNNIKELGAMREELILKKKNINKDYSQLSHCSSSNSNNELNQHIHSHHTTTSFITMHHNNDVLGIEISSDFKEDEARRFPFSKVLQLLLQQQGFEVVSCVSSQVNARILHSIHCEVNNSKNIVDVAELRRKISNVINSII